MGNIIKLNELIYVDSKLVSDKRSICLRNSNKNIKPVKEIGLEGQIKKLQKSFNEENT